MDRCQNDLLAAGAPFCGETYRKTAAHDRAAGVSRFRIRLHAAADSSLFRNQSSCLLCVRFPFHKYLRCFDAGVIAGHPQKVLADSMPDIISGGSECRKTCRIQFLNTAGQILNRSIYYDYGIGKYCFRSFIMASITFDAIPLDVSCVISLKKSSSQL